jgi:hypothetical protein
MPSESKFPSLQIPDVDLWGFLFERKDKAFADDKGKSSSKFAQCSQSLMQHANNASQ